MSFFLAPIWLLFAPLLAAVLYWTYQLRSKPQRQSVPSLFFLRKLQEKGLRSSAVMLPILFWLELLLLLSLVVLLAKPLLGTASGSAIILIDNSFSMSEQSGAAENRQSLLSLAKKEALAVYDRLILTKAPRIFVTSPTCSDLIQSQALADDDARGLRGRISTIKLSFAEDRLPTCIRKIKRQYPDAEMTVLSDRAVELPPDSKIFSRLIPSPTNSKNMAIAGIVTFGANEEQLQVDAVVLGGETSEVEARMRLYSWNSMAEKKLVADRGIKLTSVRRSEIFDLKEDDLVLGVEIQYSDRTQSDAFLLDNYAWYVRGGVQADRILIASDRTERELNVAKISGYSFDVIKPEEFALTNLSGYGMIIFDRFAPVDLPSKNTLFIVPPVQKEFDFRTTASVENQELSFYAPDHELLRYLDFSVTRRFSASLVEGPDWAEPILAVRQGSLGLAGAVRGFRYMSLGFDPFPFLGRQDLGGSVLLLNILTWLGQKQTDSSQLSREILNFNDAESWRYVDGVSLRSFDFVALDAPGLWQANAKNPLAKQSYLNISLESIGMDSERSKALRERRIDPGTYSYRNFISQVESNPRRSSVLLGSLPKAGEQKLEDVDQGTFFSPAVFFLAFVLAMLYAFEKKLVKKRGA